ncbi:MAG TPA: ABC transporter ATP-binding protein [Propionibacterium sp.]|jgi:putative ABC transport system ATP-binding protein|nr:ABC transporter ATP-binding protein [Propionibacterium sp.]
MAIVECAGLGKTYGRGPASVAALRGLDMTIDRGEFVALVGSSGSGKSTLLHILGAIERADEGHVEVAGVDLRTMDPTRAAVFRRTTVGLVYQFNNLIPTLTVRQNIVLPVRLAGKRPDPGELDRLVAALGIGDRMEALPSELSGGQQQRVAIARSVLYQPALLLADEPTGNLDRSSTADVLDLLETAHRDWGQTILLVTHDDEVAARAQRVLTMVDGRLVAEHR